MIDTRDAHHSHPAIPSYQRAALTPTIVLTVLATSVVILRLLTRHYIVHALGLDDLVITFSLILSWSVLALTVAEVESGIGAYVWTTQLDLKPANAKLVLAWNCMYMILINVTKASILMQYLRIFCTRTMRFLTYALMACLVPALLWGILGGVLLCRPVDKLWHPGKAGTCMDLRTYWHTTASVNIVLDVSTVILPIPVIWQLRLPRKQKIGLVLMFLLGFFVCGVSFARLARVHIATLRKDFTQASLDAFTWSTVEANTGIICASTLALKPLFVKVFPRLMGEPGTAKHSTALATILDDNNTEKDVERGMDLTLTLSRATTLVPWTSRGQNPTEWRRDSSSTILQQPLPARVAGEQRRQQSASTLTNDMTSVNEMDFWTALKTEHADE